MALIILALSPLALLAFVRLEEENRREVAVAIVLGLLLIEALIYPTQNGVPGGLFHPSLAGRPVRLPEAVIPIALLARVLVHGAPTRLSHTAMAWTAFVIWLAVGLPIGLMMGNLFGEAFFQSKAIIYVGGGIALVSGVPITRLAHATVIRKLFLGLGLITAIIIPFSLGGRTLGLDLPLIPGASLGRLSPDASTILSIIAVVALMLEGARRQRRLLFSIAAVPLLLTPVVATQRAAVLGVVATGAVLMIASVGRTWSRRLRATPTEAVILLCVVLVPVLATITYKAAFSTATRTEVVPLAEVVNDTFLSTRKAQSAETRQNLWREGISQIREYPTMGWGLGKTYTVDTAAGGELEDGGFHNILIDLLVRRGVVGALLFLTAIALTLRDALAVWRHHLDRHVAVFCGACGAALVGLLAKGMVESLFEKFRLATLFGLLLGAIAAGASSLREPSPDRGAASSDLELAP
ncbi:MAG: O-antigen ligase family protein [Microthrixaceae bacterium]